MGRMGRGSPELADGTMWDQEALLKLAAIIITIKVRLGSESVGAVASENEGERHEGLLRIGGATLSIN